jgi:DNA polymerase-1
LDLKGQFINCFDGRLARYLLNPSEDLSFAGSCGAYFSVTVSEEDPIALLQMYNRFIWPLKEVLTKKLQESGQYELYRTLELPLMMILSDMEFTGFRVDPDWLRRFQGVLENEIAQFQQQIDTLAGYRVNINSPKQLGILLFEEMKIPPVRKTKTGYSTDESVLEEIAPLYPVARAILDYRSSSKLKSTYVDNLLLLSDDENKVHSYLDLTCTVTGRLSSSSPNLQNIPVRTEKGRQLRRAFCAAPGHVLLSVDYSQIDLRVLAHESQDPALIQAFLEGGDIHTQTAAQVFGVMPLMVTAEMRSSAKAINFGIIYGQGPMGLSQALGISLREAKEYIDNYFRNYHVVREWIDANVALARQNGYVKTMLGHVRYLPEFNMGVGALSSFAQRAAINTIVQGGSADIIKKAMIDVFTIYRDTSVKMTMQVHDELIFELPQERLQEAAAQIKECMQNAVKLRVPLLVSAKAGKNWYELEKLPL